MNKLFLFILCFKFIPLAQAADSLSYSGRLVTVTGTPVTGPVNLKFDLGYTTGTTTAPTSICSHTISGVSLANGVFHSKLEFAVTECGGDTMQEILGNIPLGESLAIRVTDLSNTKTYSYQAIHSVPSSLVSNVAKNLSQLGATTGQILKWDGTKWAPAADGGGAGAVTEVRSGTGLSPVTINATNPSGTISIANKGVDGTLIADSAITNIKVSNVAAIARSKLENGTPSTVVINDGAGVMSDIAVVPLTLGGTGSNTALGARSNLGLGTAAVA
ncbi:MAG TPA: hypothetical protein VNJ01_03045, partial [Bacteriovoracaceae bacterium]|nr:hypothetical protein [Bacteriovoracaceae bacterium]